MGYKEALHSAHMAHAPSDATARAIRATIIIREDTEQEISPWSEAKLARNKPVSLSECKWDYKSTPKIHHLTSEPA